MTREAIYDAQIKRLTESPERIQNEWSCMFDMFAPRLNVSELHHLGLCLTEMGAFHEDIDKSNSLVLQIAQDSRIPNDPLDITVESLQAFKEYNLALDAAGIPVNSNWQ